MSRLVEIDLNPDTRTLRQFGLIAFVGFGVLAVLAYYERLIFSFGLGDVRARVAGALLAVGTLSLVFSALVPRANRLLYVTLTLLAFPIGFVLSYVIMGALYFLVIGPIAIARRVFGQDSLKREYDPDSSTYWSKARPPRDKESYFHQY